MITEQSIFSFESGPENGKKYPYGLQNMKHPSNEQVKIVSSVLLNDNSIPAFRVNLPEMANPTDFKDGYGNRVLDFRFQTPSDFATHSFEANETQIHPQSTNFTGFQTHPFSSILSYQDEQDELNLNHFQNQFQSYGSFGPPNIHNAIADFRDLMNIKAAEFQPRSKSSTTTPVKQMNKSNNGEKDSPLTPTYPNKYQENDSSPFDTHFYSTNSNISSTNVISPIRQTSSLISANSLQNTDAITLNVRINNVGTISYTNSITNPNADSNRNAIYFSNLNSSSSPSSHSHSRSRSRSNSSSSSNSSSINNTNCYPQEQVKDLKTVNGLRITPGQRSLQHNFGNNSNKNPNVNSSVNDSHENSHLFPQSSVNSEPARAVFHTKQKNSMPHSEPSENACRNSFSDNQRPNQQKSRTEGILTVPTPHVIPHANTNTSTTCAHRTKHSLSNPQQPQLQQQYLYNQQQFHRKRVSHQEWEQIRALDSPETKERRMQARQRQIDFGIETEGYKNLARLVPESERSIYDPHTPNKYQSCSKRSWDGQIRKWRRLLHLYDEAKTFEDVKQIREKIAEIHEDAKRKRRQGLSPTSALPSPPSNVRQKECVKAARLRQRQRLAKAENQITLFKEDLERYKSAKEMDATFTDHRFIDFEVSKKISALREQLEELDKEYFGLVESEGKNKDTDDTKDCHDDNEDTRSDSEGEESEGDIIRTNSAVESASVSGDEYED